jgi:nitrite reductase/ring-hydroxylating ferredoxin subunit
MHTKQWPYRSYVIGAKIPKGKLPYALWWDTGDKKSKWIAKPYHYVRLAEFDAQHDILIAGGEDHRTGRADEENIAEEDRYYRLEEWTRKHFPAIESIEYKWSGQILEPLDTLPFMGRNPGNENIYIITGQSGNGITYSTTGAWIITDLITGKKNPLSELFDPSRTSFNSGGDYLHEFGSMVLQYADWFSKSDIEKLADLKPGEGAVFSSGLKKIAVYVDENKKIHTTTAVCPHLGGVLHWNADEKTFDCPLHGSRFNAYGEVINGPASTDLRKIFLNGEHQQLKT